MKKQTKDKTIKSVKTTKPKPFTRIVLLLDKSGSMAYKKNDSLGGVNSLIEKQKLVKGKCSVSLYQFSTTVETVFDKTDIQDCPEVTMWPSGNTALYDATAEVVGNINSELKKKKERGIFVIITDGEENSSKKFNSDQVKTLVKNLETKHNWEVLYLGANQDAVFEGAKLGVVASKSMSYKMSSRGIGSSYSTVACSMTDMRTNFNKSYNGFTEEQRQAADAD